MDAYRTPGNRERQQQRCMLCTLVHFVVPFVVVVINSGLYAALDLVFYSVSDLIVTVF